MDLKLALSIEHRNSTVSLAESFDSECSSAALGPGYYTGCVLDWMGRKFLAGIENMIIHARLRKHRRVLGAIFRNQSRRQHANSGTSILNFLLDALELASGKYPNRIRNCIRALVGTLCVSASPVIQEESLRLAAQYTLFILELSSGTSDPECKPYPCPPAIMDMIDTMTCHIVLKEKHLLDELFWEQTVKRAIDYIAGTLLHLSNHDEQPWAYVASKLLEFFQKTSSDYGLPEGALSHFQQLAACQNQKHFQYNEALIKDKSFRGSLESLSLQFGKTMKAHKKE